MTDLVAFAKLKVQDDTVTLRGTFYGGYEPQDFERAEAQP